MSYEADWGKPGFSLGADVSGTHDSCLADISNGYPLEAGIGWLSTGFSDRLVVARDNLASVGVSYLFRI